MTIIAKAIASASARDYEWLKASVAGWLHRDDLAGAIPDYVVFAENRINGDLRARNLNTVVPLVDAAGTNWLIETNPELYLAATMCAALLYTRDTVEKQKWEGEYARAVGMLDFDDSNSAGPLVLANPTR